MAAFVCLLRAIGPVTHAKMSMAALRQGCEVAGFGNVATVLATGNLLLTSALPAPKVRAAVQGVVDGFGVDSEVFVRTPRELAEVVASNPFSEAAREHPSAFGVCFFHDMRQWPDWLAGYQGPERLATLDNHLFIDYGDRVLASRLQVEKRIGAKMTLRNWNTTVTLAERAAALGSS
jgi:uncharacterized protein (DUF1697 family)